MSNSAKNLPDKKGLMVFHKGLILVAVPLLIEVALILSLAFLLLESDKESLRETRYRHCAAIGTKMISLANESVIALFGSYQGDARIFLQIYDSDMKKLEERKQALQKTAAGDRLAETGAKQLEDAIDDLSPLLEEIAAPAKQGKRVIEISGMMKDIQNRFSSKRDVNLARMETVTEVQDEIAQNSGKRRQRLQDQQFKILAAGLAINVFVGLLLLNYYRKSIFKRLQVVIDNTNLLADSAALKPQISGSDEIALLDSAFHSMDKELKLAAGRERSLFENASDVICVLNTELCFVKINPACSKSWGYSSEQLIDKPVGTIIASRHKAQSEALFKAAMSEKDSAEFELLIEGSSAKKCETLWSSYFSESEKQLYCIVHDVSERKQIERMKQSFISMMSSDLRQPLYKISENIHTLLGPLQNELSAKAISRLENAKNNIVRLLDLVSDLLQLAELQSGKLDCSPGHCTVEDLLIRCVQDLEGMAQKSAIRFSISCNSEHWYVDRNRIMQVMVNLGSNAIKFSPEGSQVSIIANPQDDFVEIEVIDQGRGVPKSHQEAIFEKFQQVDAVDGKRKSGTGLGLPICKEIIEALGGSIGVRSTEGKGSKFWFRVPANEESFKRSMEQRKSKASALALKAQEEKIALLRATPNMSLTISGASPGSKISVMQKGLLLVGIPIFFELIFVCSISLVLLQTEKSRTEELHQRQIATSAYKLLNSYFATSTIIVSRNTFEKWQHYDKLCQQILDSGKSLEATLDYDKAAKSLWQPASKLHLHMIEQIKRGREIMAQGYSKEACNIAMIERFEIWALASRISKRLGRLIDESERKEFINPAKQQRLRREQGLLLAFGLASNVLLSLFLARFFSKDITSRLALEADNAGRLARDLPLNPPIPGGDEIAALDRAFHVSANKLSEARKKERAVFDNSRDMICVLDSQARFLSSNPAAEYLLACPKEELRDKSLMEFIKDKDREAFLDLVKSDLSAGKTIELQLETEEKSAYLMLSLNRPQAEENIYCIAHDISARKELEQLKQDFLSVVSHDLRSPLTSLLGTAALIEEGVTGPLGASAAPVVHDIMVQGDELSDLINDLLDLEKFEAGKMQLMPRSVSTHELLQKSLELLEKRLAADSFNLEFPSKSEVVYLDIERSAQALTSVLLHLASVSKSNECIKLELESDRDTSTLNILAPAPQLSEEESLNLFRRIKVAKPQSKIEQPLLQSQLALPLAAAIIKANQGSIKVYQSAHGNIYSIRLPKSRIERQEA